MEFLYEHPNGIRFRRVARCDLADLSDLKNESWGNTHRVSFVSDATQLKWLERLDTDDVHHPSNLILIAAATDDMPAPAPLEPVNVGLFKIQDIDWQSRSACVGWDVYKPHRRQGFGRRIVGAGVDFCFRQLNLHRLRADILITNVASRKCAESAGFVGEGLQKNAVWRDGKWVDSWIYGTIRRGES